jgi:hypothetical protein
VLNERDVTTMWRNLFNGKEVTDKSLTEAEELLDDLSPESPLRVRLSTELAEMRKMRAKK